MALASLRGDYGRRLRRLGGRRLAEAHARVVPGLDRRGGDTHLPYEGHLDAVDSGRLRNAPRKWAEPEVVN